MFLTLTVSAEVWGADFEKYSGTITEGDYLIVYSNGAMKNTVSGDRLEYTTVTVSNDKISNPDASLIWHIASSGNYWTIYNANVNKYAAGTGVKNKAQLLTTGTDDKCLWTVSGTSTYEFVNKANKAASVNSNLRRNNTYGFACYSTSTGGALTLYKKVATNFSVTAQSNNINYGTVSLSGTTITASPKTGYRVSTTTPYTISPSGSATVTQSENKFTVTPTANCTITINFEAIPKYTVTLKDDNSTLTQSTAGGNVTLPSRESCDGYKFVGWTNTWTAAQATWTTTAPTIIPDGSYTPTANESLYPVYTKTEGGGEGTLENINISPSSFSENPLGNSNYASGKEYTATIDDITFGGHYIAYNIANTPSGASAKTYIQMQKGNGNLYNITAFPGPITKIDISQNSAATANLSLYVGTEQLFASNNTQSGQTPGGELVETKTGNSITWEITEQKYSHFCLKKGNEGTCYISSISITYLSGGGSTTSYISVPDCDPCNALQAPNVMATATANSITLSWAAVSGATSYNIYNYTTEETDETTNLTYTFNGLDPETEYEWEVEAVSATCNGKGTKGTTTTQKACTDLVTIRKGTSDNGSFKLDKTEEQSTCNGAVIVTLSDIQPADGYQFSTITQSGVDDAKVTIDNVAKTVTYAQNTTGISVINVEFTELPKYTVTFDANTNGICSTISLKEEFAGAGVKLPDVIANDGYRFLGWATTNNATTANAGVAGEIYKPAIDVTLYAVYIQQFTVQWFANGELLEKVTYDKGAPLLAPTMPVNPCSDEKQHIGWTTQKEYHDPIDAPSPFFEEISGNVTANLKFYAVYATIQSAGLQPQELTETITFDSFTDGTSTRTYDGASSMWLWRKNEGSNIAVYPEIRLYAKHSMTIAPQSGCSISKIVATISENKYVSVFADGGLSGADKSVSELDVTLIPTGGNIVITQSNQSRVVKFVVTFTAAVETPEKRINYTTSCTPPAEYTITWWANGEKYHTQTAVEGTAIDVPASSDVATYACDDKVFVGWVDAEIIGSTNTEPTFITEFGEIESDKAFFAVFATETSAGIESTIHTLTPSNSWSGYKEGSITDDKGYTWSYNAAGQSTDGVYSLNLRNKDTETSYIGSPLFTANVKNIKATIVNGSASKARKVYVCSAPTLEPTTGDLGITEVAGGHSGELSLAFEGTISQFYLQVSDALQFQSIVVEVGATTTYSGYVTTCEAATEALSGKFSTGKYEYAKFATGNLQYKPSTKTWRFAKQQYQVVGEDNINVGDPNYKGWIDMLGWSTNDENNNYGVNPSCNKDLYTGDFKDWGTKMGEGWLTLSDSQWDYLLNKRPNYSKLKQIAMVGETRGIMLFPDDWTETTVDATDDAELGVNVYKYDLTQWTALEAAGAVFLPAAGRRFGGYGNTYGVDGLTDKGEEYKIQYKTNYFACYWTSTKHSDGEKVSYLFNYAVNGSSYKYSNLNLGWYEYGHAGHSVRLAKVTSTLIEIGGGDNSDVITANEGKVVNVKVNRTFKANDGYYTLCLPFDLAAEKIGNVLQISSITENVAEQGMNVVFAPVEILEAGQPYLLLPSKNIENPIFEGVTIVNTTGETTEPVSGAGIKITLTGIINGGGQTDGSTEYYVGDHGYLYNGSTAKLGLRAFFTITDDADQPVKVRARVVVGENTTTGVDNSQLPITNIQKVIENGQLIIIRNGEKFNAQGQKL